MDHKERVKKRGREEKDHLPRNRSRGTREKVGLHSEGGKKRVENDEEEPYRGVNQSIHTDGAEAKDQGEGEG